MLFIVIMTGVQGTGQICWRLCNTHTIASRTYT